MNTSMPYTALTDEEWFAKIAGISDDERECPLFPLPPTALQISTVGRDGTPILKDAFMFWQFCRKMLVQHGNGFSENTKIMDFGCAWGRIIRFWLRDLPAGNLYGCDVQERFLSLARQHVPGPTYNLSNAQPPLAMSDNSLDLIYAFSVFSHLPRDIADQWVEDFARVLKPGGIACLTTRPRAHIQLAGTADAKGAHQTVYANVITKRDTNLAKYDAGEFIFFPAHGGGVLSAETYGEAIIPADYARKHWRTLDLVGFFENYAATYLQPCFVLRKPH